jgi:hypothetical protein
MWSPKNAQKTFQTGQDVQELGVPDFCGSKVKKNGQLDLESGAMLVFPQIKWGVSSKKDRDVELLN